MKVGPFEEVESDIECRPESVWVGELALLAEPLSEEEIQSDMALELDFGEELWTSTLLVLWQSFAFFCMLCCCWAR